MSIFKEIRPKVVNQANGLVHVGRGQVNNVSDFGLVGEYNNSTAVRYAGLMRHAVDSTFYLFDSATTSPFASDVVDTLGVGFTPAGLQIGALTSTAVTASSGDIVASAGNLTAGGTATAGNLRMGTNQIISINPNGNISLLPDGSGEILLKSDPVSALGAATKQYVDNLVQGLDPKASCRAITTASLLGAPYNAVAAGSGVGKTLTRGSNGGIGGDSAAFDGVVLVANNRLLVTQDTANNGIYVVTNAGSAGAPWVLTRASDSDQSAEMTPGLFTFIEEGTLYQGTGWVLNTPAPIVIDTTSLTFVQFSSAGLLSIANVGTGSQVYANKTGNTFNLRSFLATTGSNTSNALQITQNTNDITYQFDQSKITGVGALSSGSIATGFGAINTNNAITTSNIVTGATVQTTTTLWSAVGSTNVFAGASGANLVSVPNNLANAYTIQDANLSAYFTVDTTTGAPRVVIPRGVLALSTTSGASQLSLTDNLADALSIGTSGQNFLRYVTTTGSQSILANRALNLANGTLTFSAVSGSNLLNLTTNLANALAVQDPTASVTFMRFVTTTGSPQISLPQGSIAFTAATGANKVILTDNLADALTFVDVTSSTNFLRFVTTTGSQQISLPQGSIAFTAASGSNKVVLTDNLADALTFVDVTSSTNFLRFVTTTGSQQISLPQGSIAFTAASGSNKVVLTDNLADSLSVGTSSQNFLRYVTTTGSQAVVANRALNLANGTLTFSAASGNNLLSLTTNLANALAVQDPTASVNFMQFVTTTGSPQISLPQGSIAFTAATGANKVILTDNLADALTFVDATSSTNFLRFVTTTGSQQINLLQGSIAFTAASGSNKVILTDNLADSLSIGTSSQNFLRFVSTTGSQAVLANRALNLANGTLTFSAVSGSNLLNLTTNLANALTVQDPTASVNFMQFVTTTGSPQISFPQGSIAFTAATGANKVVLTDNLADSLSIGTSSQNFLRFVSTTGSQSILANRALNLANGTLTFSAVSGSNLLNLTTNLANALTVQDPTASVNFMQFVTTTGSPQISFPQGSIAFTAATGANKVILTDNLADSLSIGTSSQNFLRYVTTTGSQAVVANRALNLANGTLTFSAASGSNLLNLTTNLANALAVQDPTASVTFMRFVTTTGSPQISLPQGSIAFTAATGSNKVILTDNLADALTFVDVTSSTNFLRFVTTTGSQQINLLQGSIAFAAASGSNKVILTDNLADSLSIGTSSQNFLRFVSTTGSQAVVANRALNLANGTLTFSAASGSNLLSLTTNLANALAVQDPTASVNFMQFVTTTGSPQISLPQGKLAFTGANGANLINMIDNASVALRFQNPTTSQAYLTFVTTTGSTSVTADVPVTMTNTVTASGSDFYVNTGLRNKTSTITGNTVLDSTYYFVLCDASTGAIVVTLPAAATHSGRNYKFVKTDSSANTVTIQPASGEALDGVTNDTLVLSSQNDHTYIESAGSSGWYIF